MQLNSFEEVTRISRPRVSTTSRYSESYQVTDGTYLFLPSYQKVDIPESVNDVYHYVSSGDAGKLDLISFKYYRTPYLWWVIARANNVLNPLRVPIGVRLRIPSLDVVFGGVV